MKKVIVSGANGQTGSYMVEYLLKNTPYKIYAAIRGSQTDNLKTVINHPNLQLLYLDLNIPSSIDNAISFVKPDYFINLGGISSLSECEKRPNDSININGTALIHILESIRKYSPFCRVFSAGSSEELKDTDSIYSISKKLAHQICNLYRDKYHLYVVHGTLFHHESERRTEDFVSKKISKGIANIIQSIRLKKDFKPIELGNIYISKDWSHASDFVDGIWKMLNQRIPTDYHLASGEQHTIKEFIDIILNKAIFDGHWQGLGILEEYVLNNYMLDICKIAQPVIIKINPKLVEYKSPVIIDEKQLCFSKKTLNWAPKISFDNLAKSMLLSDLNESGIKCHNGKCGCATQKKKIKQPSTDYSEIC